MELVPHGRLGCASLQHGEDQKQEYNEVEGKENEDSSHGLSVSSLSTGGAPYQ